MGNAYAMSLRRRKRIEEAFGWIKTAGGLRKTGHQGLAKLVGRRLLCCAAYNRTPMIKIAGKGLQMQ